MVSPLPRHVRYDSPSDSLHAEPERKAQREQAPHSSAAAGAELLFPILLHWLESPASSSKEASRLEFDPAETAKQIIEKMVSEEIAHHCSSFESLVERTRDGTENCRHPVQ